MADVMGYAAIEAEAWRLLEQLRTTTASYRGIAEAAAQASADYKIALHTNRYNSRKSSAEKMTDQTAESSAIMDAGDLLRTSLMADAKESACKQAMISLRTELEMMRSLMASHRETGD